MAGFGGGPGTGSRSGLQHTEIPYKKAVLTQLLHALPVTPIYTRNRTIGLLGGSFNPAHGGHLHITLHALKKLGLDEVWWLVSPRNPLKSADALADYGQRLASAVRVASAHPRIRVLDIEARFGTRYSYQTLSLLKERFPGTHFVWMIGADNLAQFHRWKRWQAVLAAMPVVVFDRAPYSHTALRSKAYIRGSRFLMKNPHKTLLSQGPCLVFIHLKRDPLSSSDLRKKLGAGAFLRHNNNAGSLIRPARKEN
jgi:nicotinate-nucleotide adenylyltransferase